MSAVSDPTTGPAAPKLTLIQSTGPQAHAPSQDERPLLARVCAGEPIVLTSHEADFTTLLNDAVTDDLVVLDPDLDFDDVQPAEYVLEFYVSRYGSKRHANGDRVEGLASDYGRYVIPFLVELATSLPQHRRGMAKLGLAQVERLPRILAGERALPAATVAADRLRPELGRVRAVQCLHLTLEHAAHVVDGGATALSAAIDTGVISPVADTRTGIPLVRPVDLRAAGLLIEPERPHGLAKSSATNVLRALGYAFERAAALGARPRAVFDLEALEPLNDNRQRAKRAAPVYRSIAQVAAVAAAMPPIGQLQLWLERLLGVRISEGYGPCVRDYRRDENGRAWLDIYAQGGLRSLERDAATGRLEGVDAKTSTKTEASKRQIPVPAQLATLIESFVTTFHTDPETGLVDADARLVPGLQKDDVSGQSTFRAWLAAAQDGSVVPFEPHTCLEGCPLRPIPAWPTRTPYGRIKADTRLGCVFRSRTRPGVANRDRRASGIATGRRSHSPTPGNASRRESLTADLAAKALGRPPARLSVRVHAALTARRRP